jgi:hypothetical protein
VLSRSTRGTSRRMMALEWYWLRSLLKAYAGEVRAGLP